MRRSGPPDAEGPPFKVAASSFLGNFIEWFDYATYTYFAITIGIVFFPESVNSTLLAFAVFALSFVFRPLGAAFWAAWATRRGASGRCRCPSFR